jgi:hypothetical protein
MEQKDYILREIEKIGQMLRMLVDKIKQMKSTDSESISEMVDEHLALVSEGMNFDVKGSLMLGEKEFEAYLMRLPGTSVPNLEMLADLLFELGTGSSQPRRSDCLKSALRIYEATRKLDRVFSITREEKIYEIRSLLSRPFRDGG